MHELQRPPDRAGEAATKRRDWDKIFVAYMLGVGAFTFTTLALGVAVIFHPGFDVPLILTFVIAGVFWVAALFPWLSPRVAKKSED